MSEEDIVWVIVDTSKNSIRLTSGMAFTSKAACQSYCYYPGETPFQLFVITKKKNQFRKLSKEK